MIYQISENQFSKVSNGRTYILYPLLAVTADKQTCKHEQLPFIWIISLNMEIHLSKTSFSLLSGNIIFLSPVPRIVLEYSTSSQICPKQSYQMFYDQRESFVIA